MICFSSALSGTYFCRLPRDLKEWLVLNGYPDPTLSVKRPSVKGTARLAAVNSPKRRFSSLFSIVPIEMPPMRERHTSRLLPGRPATFEMKQKKYKPETRRNEMMKQINLGGSFTLANTSLTVNRMGYGAMQLAGPEVWGPPRDPDEAVSLTFADNG